MTAVRALDFLHVPDDSDGDHRVDASDPQPNVFCLFYHTNVGGFYTPGGNWAIDVLDLGIMLSGEFGDEPPANDMIDLNHNGAADPLDLAQLVELLGTTYTPADCSSGTPDAVPIDAQGATNGPTIELHAPVLLSGTEGQTSVVISTAGNVPDPYEGYGVWLSFDPAVVQFQSRTNLLEDQVGCTGPVLDESPGNVLVACSSSHLSGEVTTSKPLLRLNFDVLAPGVPAFCIESYAAPDNAGALRGTYTVGDDLLPQVQTMGKCGRPPLAITNIRGVSSTGLPVVARSIPQGVHVTLPAFTAQPVRVTYSGTGCALGLPGLPMQVVLVDPAGWVYGTTFGVPADCAAGTVLTVCAYVGDTVLGCVSEYLIDPSGYVYAVADPTLRISGAVVTLERFDGIAYVPLDAIADYGEFEPLDNPQITGSDGRYGWDVIAGTYRVTVSKDGCDTVTSAPVAVPPPVTDLNIGLTCSDADSDGYADLVATSHAGPANINTVVDNCPGDANAGQENSDGNFIDQTPPKLFNDVSWPNSDAAGDACDIDDDNDGLSDTDEISGAACGGIITLPLERDTDGDRKLDGAECGMLGTNPTTIGPNPAACAVSGDADGDGLLDSRELCFYNSNGSIVNTDGDTRNDGCEVYSVNGDQSVNVLDLQQIASEAGAYSAPGTVVQRNYDVTKNGTIDVIDLQQTAAADAICP
jgi:hypothetical protein